MSPFGNYIANARRARQLQQKQLAYALNINPAYISALESGRKPPPSTDLLQKFVVELALNEEEQRAFWESVELSATTLRLPTDLSLDEYKLLHQLKQKLGTLSKQQIAIMQMAMDLNLAK